MKQLLVIVSDQHQDFLRCDLSSLGAVRLCYLDHTGCFASRASHIEALGRIEIKKSMRKQRSTNEQLLLFRLLLNIFEHRQLNLQLY